MRLQLLLAATITFFTSTFGTCGQDTVLIKTDLGDIKVVLFESTPLHSANFKQLVEEGFYDSLLFHRVMDNFMIQGGSPDSRTIAPGLPVGLGAAGGTEVIPNEFDSSVVHKRGTLCAARAPDPPDLETSACQFYIVQSGPKTDFEMDRMQMQWGGVIPEEHREVYKTVGGTPHLYLLQFTVFGEVIEGMDVVDKIAKVPRDNNNRPLEDVRMYMEVVNN